MGDSDDDGEVRLPTETQALREDNGGASNAVSSTKYNAVSFVPHALALQFRRFGNVYFAVVIVLMMLGLYSGLFESSITPWGQLATLAVILTLNILAEGADDLARHRSDRAINAQQCDAMDPSSAELAPTAWGGLRRGQLVKLRKDDEVPADALLLLTAHAHADPCAYVETANIDGESYLKRVQVHEQLLGALAPRADDASDHGGDAQEELRVDFARVRDALRGRCVRYTSPCASLSSFRGQLALDTDSRSAVAFSAEHMLFRGARLRNVPWALALVLYTGTDTKVLMADGGAPAKQSRVDRSTNRVIAMVLLLLLLLVLLSLFFFFAGGWEPAERLWYLQRVPEGRAVAAPVWLAQLCQYVILYKNILPILLYAVLEGLAQAHARLVAWDERMHCTARGRGATCNTTSLAQETGQVRWLFADKTGTLTRNELRVVAFATAGDKLYGACDAEALRGVDGAAEPGENPAAATRRCFAGLLGDRETDERAAQLLRAMALCHTVLIDRDASPRVRTPEVSADGAQVVRTTEGGDAGVPAAQLRGRAGSRRDSTVRIRRAYESSAALDSPAPDASSSADGGFGPQLADQLVYNAESPDEEALVACAGALGYQFVATEGQSMAILHVQHGPSSAAVERWEVLAVNAFSSARKRMSVVYRDARAPEELLLLCKGADSAMLAALAASQDTAFAEEQLRAFSEAGMRTLVVAQRRLSCDEFRRWKERSYDPAAEARDSEERRQLRDAAGDELERDLELLGVTCIEDRLQEGVPDTVALLRAAGLRVWVITGDKVETALSIARSVRLIDADSTLLRLTRAELDAAETKDQRNPQEATGDVRVQVSAGGTVGTRLARRLDALLAEHAGADAESAQRELERARDEASSRARQGALALRSLTLAAARPFARQWRRARSWARSVGAAEPRETRESDTGDAKLALVLDGELLSHIVGDGGDPHLQRRLLALARRCGAVLACRASPAQKALLVHMVARGGGDPVTLAVGDGTNDVPMIQAASVGVGIAGREGTQAASAADFSLARFKDLAPLLLVHGRLAYIRVGKAVLLVFYANVMFTWASFLAGFFAMFSGTAFFSDLQLTMINVFVAVPVFLLGFFDTDVLPVHAQLRRPQGYAVGQRNGYLNAWTVALYLLRGMAHGTIAFALVFMRGEEVSLAGLSARYYLTLLMVLTLREVLSASSISVPFAVGIAFNVLAAIGLTSVVTVMETGSALLFGNGARQLWSGVWTALFLVATLDVLGPMGWFFARYGLGLLSESTGSWPSAAAKRLAAALPADQPVDQQSKAKAPPVVMTL